MQEKLNENNFFEDRIREFLVHLNNLSIVSSKSVTDFDYKECGYKVVNALPKVDSSFTKLSAGEYWGNCEHLHAWLHKRLEIPSEMVGKDIVLRATTQKDGWNVHNPQFIAYIDGVLVQGLDTNHREVYLDNAKKSCDLYLYAYTSKCGDPLELNAKLINYDKNVVKLYHTISIALETCLMYEKHEKVYADIEKCVTEAVNLIDMRKE